MHTPITPLIAIALVLTACGEPAAKLNPDPATESVAPTAVTRPDAGGRLRIEVDDTMRFSTTSFEVRSGERVSIELAHTGTFPKAAMGHNLVILTPATDVDQFAVRAMSAWATDFIPADSDSEIVAHSELIGGGETSTFEFVAPAPGVYPFLCSFLGHAAIMRGEMIVREG